MDTSAILAAIDEQISKLEQAKAILVGGHTPPESVPKKKSMPAPEPKHRGRPKGSVNKKAAMPEVAVKAAKHMVSEPEAALVSTAKKARKTVVKKAAKPVKSAAKKPGSKPAKKMAAKTPGPKPAKKSVSGKSISAKSISAKSISAKSISGKSVSAKEDALPADFETAATT